MSLKIGAVIQARLGSTRLKQKALRQLDGQELIRQVYNQARGSQLVQEIILMTSDEPLDLNLIEFFQKMGLGYSTGPVDDIVGRLWKASQKYSFDYLVRIWGDCPFICPDIIDAMLKKVVDENLDFISNSDIQRRTFPPGLDIEIYSKTLLENMNSVIQDVKKREFPIEYVRGFVAPEKQARYHDTSTPALNASDLHLTIDYAEDLSAANEIYKILKSGQQKSFHYPELKNLILQQPDLFKKFSKEARNTEYKNFIEQSKKESL